MAGGRVLGAHAGGARYLAREEVILCCGALGTPKLLMLSGIGPADELRSMSIEVAVDVPAVGQHLSDHPEAVLILAPARPAPPCAVHGWEAGAFVRSAPAAAEPDVVLHFATVPHDANVAGHGYLTAGDAMTVSAFVARPLSRGRLHLRSADPAVGPVVAPGFFTDRGGSDIATLAAGLAVAREIVRQPALRPWIAAELAPPGSGSGEDLTGYVRKTAGTMFHPAGTCRMGAPGTGCVVTPDLRVDGVDGVRIADASIFPEMVSVNPCVTCLMIGEKCAELVLDDLGAGS
jgi:choline dehydrogenase-like flavoprotein